MARSRPPEVATIRPNHKPDHYDLDLGPFKIALRSSGRKVMGTILVICGGLAVCLWIKDVKRDAEIEKLNARVAASETVADRAASIAETVREKCYSGDCR